MKIIIIRSHLRDGLFLVDRAVGENQNLPILKNVLIEAEGGKVVLTATNLEIAVQASVSGKVIEEGRATVPAGIFSGLINNLQGERLNIEASGAALKVATDNYKASIQCLSSEDFPLVPKIKNETEFVEIKGGLLKEALAQTLVSAQYSDLRPELSCVLAAFSLNDLKLVATDSFRLSEKTIPGGQIKRPAPHAFSSLIPLKTAHELLRILKDDEEVKMFNDQNQALFSTPRFELVTRLVNGSFPDYAAIIPPKYDAEAVIQKAELMNALKVVGVLGGKAGEVVVSIPEQKKTIEISSSEKGVGENSMVLSARASGSIKETRFNWKYLLDGLKTIEGDEVLFGINEENKPAILRAPNDQSYFYILMPILGA